MAKKVMTFKTRGMNRDLSVSAFNPEFSFENRNLRLCTNEDNTLMSWVNERGTKELTHQHWERTVEGEREVVYVDPENPLWGEPIVDQINGAAIGTAIINNQLILFTHKAQPEANEPHDYIYLLKFADEEKTNLQTTVLFSGELNFDIKSPIETLVSYEGESIQKVYWTDNRNNLRVINIARDYGTQNTSEISTVFDFSRELQLKETVEVTKIESVGGEFPSGVIQYAFTYYDKNIAESCIFHTTPLHYISHTYRGGAPDEKIGVAFNIKVSNIDKSFDYLRIYSIIRTSLNGEAIVKRITDIEIDKDSQSTTIEFVDSNVSGEIVDSSYLLYVGGESVIAKTLAAKDGTLFLGNLKLNRKAIPDSVKTQLLEENGVNENNTLANNRVYSVLDYRPFTLNSTSTIKYLYTLGCPSTETYKGAAAFKNNEYYRLGIQFQHKTGKWSEPCWIGDKRITINDNGVYGPISDDSGTRETDEHSPYEVDGIGVEALPEFRYTLSSSIQKALYNAGYRKARALYASPRSLYDRTILCQGVICPTLYRNADDAYNHPSWVFRFRPREDNPARYRDWINASVTRIEELPGGGTIERTYLSERIAGIVQYKGKIFNPVQSDSYSQKYWESSEIQGNYEYLIDSNIVTLHSPEIEIEELGYIIPDSIEEGYSIYHIGEANMSKTYSDIDIQTSSPTIKGQGVAFKNKYVGEHSADAALLSPSCYLDSIVKDFDETPTYGALSGELTWPIYMWHRSGSLNNDVTRLGQSSVLLKKTISNYRLSSSTEWLGSNSSEVNYEFLRAFDGGEGSVVKFGDITYQGNINTVLSTGEYYPFFLDSESLAGLLNRPYTKLQANDDGTYPGSLGGYYIWDNTQQKWVRSQVDRNIDLGKYVPNLLSTTDPVSIKFKSSPHIIIAGLDHPYHEYEGNNQMAVFEIRSSYDTDTFFGGLESSAFQNISWLPCGPAIDLNILESTTIEYKWGDTYFQRYECLKTYPYTFEDRNQVVEIGSFVLETRVNVDGRYDRNRSQSRNLDASSINFNLVNPVYSQLDNFFSYRILPKDYYENTKFINQITWTQTKSAGSLVDAWTNVTLASILELDGATGAVNKLVNFNNQLLAFQDTGIAQILYNENVQIPSTLGAPIELANSGKVQGKRYLTNIVGCSNKWSVANTVNGVYFIDSNGKSIYLLNEGIQDLSSNHGFNSWCKQNIPTLAVDWDPKDFMNFVTYYDRLNQDILFINKDTALAFSEKLGEFTSFYDYGETPYFCNLEDTGIWLRSNSETTRFWKHQAGNYCRFFGINKPYSITLVGNPEPQADKIFTNLEFRACVEGEGSAVNEKYIPAIPFDYLETWNEYQHGKANLSVKSGTGSMQHHLHDQNTTASLNRKFRMWGCDIPRDNWPLCPMPNPLGPNPTEAQEEAYNTAMKAYNDEKNKGITRYFRKPNDRMRNPWIYLELQKNRAEDYIQDDIGSTPSLVLVNLPKVEIHDIVMTYYN